MIFLLALLLGNDPGSGQIARVLRHLCIFIESENVEIICIICPPGEYIVITFQFIDMICQS